MGSPKKSVGSKSEIIPNLLIATHSGELEMGDIRVPCHVLENDKRVLDQRGFVALLTSGRESGNLTPYIDKIPNKPNGFSLGAIAFRSRSGRAGHGYSAEQVTVVIQLYASAFIAGHLHHSQVHIGQRCATIACALIAENLTKKIDDVTGFSSAREWREFQLRCQFYLEDRKSDWTRQFPEEFYEAANRMNGRADLGGRPSLSPSFYRNYVYDILLGKDIAAELKRRIPNPRRGNNQHQLLVNKVKEHLSRYLSNVIVLFDQSHCWDEFKMRFDHQFKKTPLQLSFGDQK